MAKRGDGVIVAALRSLDVTDLQLAAAATQALALLGVRFGSRIPVFRVNVFPTNDMGKVKRREIEQLYQISRNDAAAASLPDDTASRSTLGGDRLASLITLYGGAFGRYEVSAQETRRRTATRV